MSLVLTRATTPTVDIPEVQHLWPVSITAVSDLQAEGIPSEIFVYHRPSLLDETGAGDIFEAVASASQIEELGTEIEEPEDDAVAIPYYRSATCVFYCRSADEAEEVWELIKVDAQELVDNIRAANILTEEEEYEIP